MSNNNALMAGKRGLIMGVANDRSLAWGIARAVHEAGAELAFSYQGEALGRRVRPLAQTERVWGSLLVPPSSVIISVADQFRGLISGSLAFTRPVFPLPGWP